MTNSRGDNFILSRPLDSEILKHKKILYSSIVLGSFFEPPVCVFNGQTNTQMEKLTKGGTMDNWTLTDSKFNPLMSCYFPPVLANH